MANANNIRDQLGVTVTTGITDNPVYASAVHLKES